MAMPRQEWRSMWVNAMATVAAEYTGDIDTLSPQARNEAALRAEALTSCAAELFSDRPLPPATSLLTGLRRTGAGG
jgi:hypothetical protein